MPWTQKRGLTSLVAELAREEPDLDLEILRSVMLSAKEPLRGWLEGDRALMLAVLDDWIRSYLSSVKRVAKEAEYWVHSDKWHSPFSFVVICKRFELDSEAVRTALKHLREQMDAANQK